jgi:hypothetical protein
MADQPKPKLKPSTILRPWHGSKTQANLNAERLSPWHGYPQNAKRLNSNPLLKVVNERAHKRIANIRNSRSYQEAHDQNAQSALKLPKLKGMQIGRFSVSSSSVKPVVLLNGKHGRFTVSNEEPSAASASATSVAASVPSLPSHHKTSRGRAFTIENRSNGGRRTRKHRRKNISRRRRHVGRRRTHRNGA